jgi:hypothetical protein
VHAQGTASATQMTKVASFPAWLVDMFSCIDKKDFAGARKYLADDLTVEFAHYKFKGIDQVIKGIGGVDAQFFSTNHGIEQVWQGEGVVMFGGQLTFVLTEGSQPLVTPFWDIFIMATDNPQKVVSIAAIFDFATVPQSYWPKV